ncbi:hypothetical protein HCJ92_14365 [Streptomyces sp. ventii]|uniref:Type II secretion system protein GspF domain-containing protein n=1 Tax=Streptomyces spiramenti TaxID=2720606 RepID=A0ABX1AJZ8_9ACTN|nr:hypothetical protein [Streptomyces spiramenti]
MALSSRPTHRRVRAVLRPHAAGTEPGLAAPPKLTAAPFGSTTGHGSSRTGPPALRALLRNPPARGAVACLIGGVVTSFWGSSPIPLVAALVAAPLVARRLLRRRQRQLADRRSEAVIAFCSSLAAETRAGHRPESALREAGPACLGPAAAEVSEAARTGGDVAAALRRTALLPGAAGLAGVAACWQVATDGGASLATGLDRVAHALRTDRDTREDLRAQLAGPRTTVVVLACLPAAGLLLGTALGAAPLSVLLNDPAGLACLLIGGALEVAGLLWTSGIVRAAERSAA